MPWMHTPMRGWPAGSAFSKIANARLNSNSAPQWSPVADSALPIDCELQQSPGSVSAAVQRLPDGGVGVGNRRMTRGQRLLANGECVLRPRQRTGMIAEPAQYATDADVGVGNVHTLPVLSRRQSLTDRE